MRIHIYTLFFNAGFSLWLSSGFLCSFPAVRLFQTTFPITDYYIMFYLEDASDLVTKLVSG